MDKRVAGKQDKEIPGGRPALTTPLPPGLSLKRASQGCSLGWADLSPGTCLCKNCGWGGGVEEEQNQLRLLTQERRGAKPACKERSVLRQRGLDRQLLMGFAFCQVCLNPFLTTAFLNSL